MTLEIVGARSKARCRDGATATNTVIAYEPVWAIGTGLTPTPADVAEVHGFIRGELARDCWRRRGSASRILYGGSVKPANARELLCVPDVDGALVGGASLKASRFLCNSIGLCGRGRAESRRSEGVGKRDDLRHADGAGSRAGGRSFRRGSDAIAALHCRGAGRREHGSAVWHTAVAEPLDRESCPKLQGDRNRLLTREMQAAPRSRP